jgi:hypothetical protein
VNGRDHESCTVRAECRGLQHIAPLSEQLRALRCREAELSAAIEDEAIGEPTPAELAEIRAMVGDGILDAPIPQRKAILQKFVSEVRFESRRTTHLVFRLPLRGVREVFRLVEAAGVEPASETESPGTSTSVSRILISPGGSSWQDPFQPAAVTVPERGRGAPTRASRCL